VLKDISLLHVWGALAEHLLVSILVMVDIVLHAEVASREPETEQVAVGAWDIDTKFAARRADHEFYRLKKNEHC
jgi:hypothetical protein